jgi:hypothetical protein
MGRFDGPHFRDEQNDVVSVWVATCAFDEIPGDYFTEPSDDNDDEPWNKFSTDFGFGYYDHDVFETNHADGSMVPVREILMPCSYASSFVDPVVLRSQQLSVSETSFIVLLYNFRYDVNATGILNSPRFLFLGVFDYDRS